MNTVAWVVKLTYLHVVVNCESLLGGHGKARCAVTVTRAQKIALRFRTKTSIAVLKEEESMENFWFCRKDVYENFENRG